MTLPPERISIKRRRQDEPIDTLILEPGLAPDKKRQFTDFCFQRLHHDQPPPFKSDLSSVAGSSNTSGRQNRDYEALGIPSIKHTKPGDEVRDYAEYKSALSKQYEEDGRIAPHAVVLDHSKISSRPLSPVRQQTDTPARRFHLARDLSSPLKPSHVGGIRRPKSSLRPPLATFIERHSARIDHEVLIYQKPPVDRLVELNDQAVAQEGSVTLGKTSIGKKTQISTFRKPLPPKTRRGHSIRDDPTTWDHSSDQLANELAALAFDIDPADATGPPLSSLHVEHAASIVDDMDFSVDDNTVVNNDDDFIFETYVRVRRDQNVELLTSHPNTKVGLLVIDDENEDLWEKYVNSDDEEDDWDEEDADSNAEENPRNEYPDEEISTDDEFGYNPYKYRHHGSDNEEDGSDNDRQQEFL